MTRYGFEEHGGAIRASWVTRAGPAGHTVLPASDLLTAHGLAIAAALETLSGHVWDCYTDPGATHALHDEPRRNGRPCDDDPARRDPHRDTWGDTADEGNDVGSWRIRGRDEPDMNVSGPALSRAYEHEALARLDIAVETGFANASLLCPSSPADPSSPSGEGGVDAADHDPDADLDGPALAATATEELGQRLGRAVRAAGQVSEQRGAGLPEVVPEVLAEVLDAVLAEVRAEVAAVGAAERGELTGRAAQATDLGSPDPSPAQVAATDAVLRRDLFAGPDAFADADPAAAAMAAAHWLDAAAQVTAELWGGEAEAVIEESDNIAALAVAVPTAVLARLGVGHTPREIVTDLLDAARLAAGGEIPDPPGLLAQYAEAMERSEELNRRGLIDDPDLLLPSRVCLLDPRRAAVQLLEELTEAITGCLRLYLEYDDEREQAPWTPDDEPDDETVERFYRGVRARARGRFRAAVAAEATLAAARLG